MPLAQFGQHGRAVPVELVVVLCPRLLELRMHPLRIRVRRRFVRTGEHDRPASGGTGQAVVRSLDDRGGGGDGGVRTVRRPEWWDRIKILFFLLLAFAALFWATVGQYDLQR